MGGRGQDGTLHLNLSYTCYERGPGLQSGSNDHAKKVRTVSEEIPPLHRKQINTAKPSNDSAAFRSVQPVIIFVFTLMTMLGKSSMWTSRGSSIPFLVTMICFGCSSTGIDRISAATCNRQKRNTKPVDGEAALADCIALPYPQMAVVSHYVER